MFLSGCRLAPTEIILVLCIARVMCFFVAGSKIVCGVLAEGLAIFFFPGDIYIEKDVRYL